MNTNFKAKLITIFNSKKRIRKLLEELEIAHVELEALKSIDVVIVQTVSGLPLFEKQYEQVGVDSFLISGMTSAISAFLTELDSDSMFGFETVERQNLSITSHKAVSSTMIVISKKKLPLIILNQIEKTHIEVQRVFYQDFIGHEGGFDLIDPNKMEEVFINSGFKVELLQNKLIIDTSVIKKIQKNDAIRKSLRQKLDLFRKKELSQFYNASNTINLNGISEYLRQQGLSPGFISSIIFLMYANKGIKLV